MRKQPAYSRWPRDLTQVLEEHYRSTKNETKSAKPYWYTSTYVKLKVYLAETSPQVTVLLEPARGFRIVGDIIAKEGCDDILAFP